MIKKAVIPAAGLGLRFLPATKAQPKEMLPLVDKPAIQYVVEEAVASGIDDIIIVTGRGKRAIEDHFDKSVEIEQALERRGKIGMLKNIRRISDIVDKIHYVRQKEQKGLGDAILCVKKHIGSEPFAVLLGDDVIINSYKACTKQLIDIYSRFKSPIIAVRKVDRKSVSKYGIVDASRISNNTYLINDMIEKPSIREAPSNLAIIGRYIMTPEIFGILEKLKPGYGGEIQLTDAIRKLRNRRKLYACEFDGERYDIGDKVDWIRANVLLTLERDDIEPKLKEELRSFLKKL